MKLKKRFIWLLALACLGLLLIAFTPFPSGGAIEVVSDGDSLKSIKLYILDYHIKSNG
ncbi:hypothetical protein [Planococcus sp. ISL-109]|uniref:hypothetical protein n=1 Tax=Planococcus sp. ISL-109 TaxID=2819166 RepID=UPI001BEABC53|nr:hypothetical protein [Planococcus sp. ISL-109]MBT2581189.1 hypothetical protein [Planococcus sp. ISL-109]